MSDSIRIFPLTPPVGNGVQGKAIAREPETTRWTRVVPRSREMRSAEALAGSVFVGDKEGWATFTAPGGAGMRFDLRTPLRVQAGNQAVPSPFLLT